METCKNCHSRVCLIGDCDVHLQSCRRDSMTSKYANYLHTILVVSPIRSFIFDSYKPVVSCFMVHLRSRFHPPAAPPPAPFSKWVTGKPPHFPARGFFNQCAKTALEKHVFTMMFYILFQEHQSAPANTRQLFILKSPRAIHNLAPPQQQH